MDYEKKYKEALEKARNFELPEYKNIMESIFPELKESEDEKIRKDIIKMINNTCKGEWFIDSSKEECLLWLEGQQVKEPIISLYENKTCKENDNSLTGEDEKNNSYCQEYCKGYQQTGKCFADGECNAKNKI